jgi:TonB family protein
MTVRIIRHWARLAGAVFFAGALHGAGPPAAAQASDPAGPNSATFWIGPKEEALVKLWPHDANGAPVYGSVHLSCVVETDGTAGDCQVRPQARDLPSAAQAALQLAKLYKARRSTPGVRASLEVSVLFDVGPSWQKKPTFDQLLALFPVKAANAGQSGHATIRCWVQTNGLLHNCTVTDESPQGYGFGGAALALTPSFLLRPALRQGKPVESQVSIPINFPINRSGGFAAISKDPGVHILNAPVWAAAPGAQDVNRAIATKVRASDLAGQVALQCEVANATGTLDRCLVMNASVERVGFEAAAKALATKFRLRPGELKDPKADARVNLSFDFPNMSREGWEKRYLTHPQWKQIAVVDPKTPVFPDEAAHAGLKQGSAVVECTVGAGGTLTDCATVQETPPNLGFGPIALAVAKAYAVNPWDDSGLPAEGAQVRMPVTLKLAPEAAAAEAPKP